MQHRILAPALSLIGLAACMTGPPADVCQITVLVPRTGPQARIGAQIQRAATMVEDSLSRLSGPKVDLRLVDTGGDPATASLEVSRQTRRKDRAFIVGSIFSSETRQFLRSALEAGAFIIANGSSDPSIDTLSFRHPLDGFFRNWPRDDFEGMILAEYAAGILPTKRIAVLHADDPYARALANAFVLRFESLGGRVTAHEVYPTAIADPQAVVARVAKVPFEGLVLIGFPADLAAVYDAIRRNPSTRPSPIFSGAGVASGDFDQLVRVRPIDLLYFAVPASAESSREYSLFASAYASRFANEQPDVVAAISFDALWIAANTARASNCSALAATDLLHAALPFLGVTGPTGFDSLGNVVTKPISIRVFEDGRQRLVKIRSPNEQ